MIRLLEILRYLLTTTVMNRKKVVSEEAVLSLSIVKKIVPIVSLVTYVIFIYWTLQSASARALTAALRFWPWFFLYLQVGQELS